MRVYPVLDLKGGLVVRGKAGDRVNYRPIESSLAPSPQPLAIARAFRERFGLDQLYVADLDALGGGPPAAGILRQLCDDGFALLVDAGTRSRADAELVAATGAAAVVAALETLPSPAALAEVAQALGTNRVIFSLDLKGGDLLGNPYGWPCRDPFETAARAVEAGIRRLLILDLASVGAASGPMHLPLLRRLHHRFAEVEILTGGGVRSGDDLRLLAAAGAGGVLVASALHDGAITRKTLEEVGLAPPRRR